MDVVDAYARLRSYRAAGEVCGVDPKTVKRKVLARRPGCLMTSVPSVSAVHDRASVWFAAQQLDRAAALIVEYSRAYYTRGRYATISRWVESLPRDLVTQTPGLCACAVFAPLGLADNGGVSVWLQLGEHAVAASPEGDATGHLLLKLLRSTTNTATVGPALEAAAACRRELPPGNLRAAACYVEGAWSWQAGVDGAADRFREGAREAAVFGGITMEASCNAMLSLLTQSAGDAARAWSLACHARQLLEDHGLEQAPVLAVATAVYALGAAKTGRPDVARANLVLARSQLSENKDVFGWANTQIRLALAQTSLLIGDTSGAATILAEVSRLGPSSLTTAELRVLHYLPTNLTLAELVDRLFVSRYTVKTHCEPIYRSWAWRRGPTPCARRRAPAFSRGTTCRSTADLRPSGGCPDVSGRRTLSSSADPV
jgi:LuxR family maltose regulon positive regulatory protein